MATLAKALFAIIMIGGMALVVVMVAGGAKEGQGAIDAWATGVRGGQPVTGAQPGEVEAIAAAVRASTSTSVGNFLSQSNTSCFWVTLDDKARSELKVLLVESAGKQVVAEVSLSRECECPDDVERCHLE